MMSRTFEEEECEFDLAHELIRVSTDGYEQRAITVKVLRESSPSSPSRPIELRLIPRRDWGGRGLLGCHLVPL